MSSYVVKEGWRIISWFRQTICDAYGISSQMNSVQHWDITPQDALSAFSDAIGLDTNNPRKPHLEYNSWFYTLVWAALNCPYGADGVPQDKFGVYEQLFFLMMARFEDLPVSWKLKIKDVVDNIGLLVPFLDGTRSPSIGYNTGANSDEMCLVLPLVGISAKPERMMDYIWYDGGDASAGNPSFGINYFYDTNGELFWTPMKSPSSSSTSVTTPADLFVNAVYNPTGGQPTFSPPAHKITTMAYHNFSTGEWETLDDWNFGTSVKLDPLHMISSASIGFSPMTNLSLPPDGNKLESAIDNAGRPTDTFGFPFHDRYDTTPDQKFNLSEYIDEPVILKGWEVRMNVVPSVGDPNFNPADTYVNATSNPYTKGFLGHSNNFYKQGYPSSISFDTNDNTNWSSNAVLTTDGDGFITKGVTCFLLREQDIDNKEELKNRYYDSDRYFSYSTNTVESNSGVDKFTLNHNKFSITPGSTSVSPLIDNKSNTFTGGSTSLEYFSSNSNRRELLGYLQHVYHNNQNYDTGEQYNEKTKKVKISEF